MTLPSDDHKGWDRLFAAVVDDGPADTTTGAPDTDEAEPERVLDLESLQARAGALSGDAAGEAPRV